MPLSEDLQVVPI